MRDQVIGAGDIEWRHLPPHLWVAIGPLGHMGTIEQGRRFTVLDTHGEVRARCRTLDAAKLALAAVGDHTAHDRLPAA